jgi:hypothetical protein
MRQKLTKSYKSLKEMLLYKIQLFLHGTSIPPSVEEQLKTVVALENLPQNELMSVLSIKN